MTATPIRGNAAGTAYLHRPGLHRSGLQASGLQASGLQASGLQASGPGTTLVLLHGIGSNAESWAPLMASLDPALDAIAWDAPGYGTSEPITDPAPSPADYAARLALFLDTLGLHRIVLGGHSLGCLFAARFAASHPNRVAALALLSPALGYGVAAGAPLPPAVQARIDDLARLGPTDFAAKRAARLVHRPEAKPTVLAGVQRAMAAVNLPGYARAVHALGSGTLLADAARIATPTLVATGAEDVVTPPSNARSLHAVLPRAWPLLLVADAGHALPQEAPSLIAHQLAALIQENAHD